MISSLGKIFLFRVTAEIVERQDRERRFVRVCCEAGDNLFVLGVDRPHKSIAAAGQGLDPTVPAGRLAQHSPQRGNLDCEVTFLDGEAGPCRLQQRILRYWGATPFDQHAQQSHGSRPERDRRAATEEDRRLGVETEWAKGVTRQSQIS